VYVAIVERRVNQELIGQRAGGLHARTIEVFDQRGIADRFLGQGKAMQVAAFALVPLSIEDFPTRHNDGLALRQRHIERILAGWVDELGVTTYRGREVTGFTQDAGGVKVQLADGGSFRAEYLVGCDGGRSLVRKAAGIEFPGADATTGALIAEARLAQEPRPGAPEWGIRRTATGINALSRIEDSGLVGILVTEGDLRRAGEEATLDDLRAGLIAA